MSPAPNLCVGCSSTLDGAAALPVFSEKPQPVHYYGCSHFLCGRCARANRGLLRYCMRCETVGELLGGARVGGSSILPPPVADSEGFVIGDDEDEAPPQEELPQYDPVDRKLDQAAQHIKDGQSTIHYLKPQETLSGLALRYRVDVRFARTTREPADEDRLGTTAVPDEPTSDVHALDDAAPPAHAPVPAPPARRWSIALVDAFPFAVRGAPSSHAAPLSGR